MTEASTDAVDADPEPPDDDAGAGDADPEPVGDRVGARVGDRVRVSTFVEKASDERFVAAIPLPRHSDRTWARADAGCRDVTAGNCARGDDARWVSASEKIHVAPVSSE